MIVSTMESVYEASLPIPWTGPQSFQRNRVQTEWEVLSSCHAAVSELGLPKVSRICN